MLHLLQSHRCITCMHMIRVPLRGQPMVLCDKGVSCTAKTTPPGRYKGVVYRQKKSGTQHPLAVHNTPLCDTTPWHAGFAKKK